MKMRPAGRGGVQSENKQPQGLAYRARLKIPVPTNKQAETWTELNPGRGEVPLMFLAE
jgi:hypothetical protein